MGSATSITLSVQQLRHFANDAEGTLQNLEAVLNSLASSDEEIINWACEALENCGTPAINSLPALQRSVVDSHEGIATWACKLVARMGNQAATAQPQLIEAMQEHKSMPLREEAARALGTVGPLSAEATKVLEQAAKDGSPRLKRIATAALGQ